MAKTALPGRKVPCCRSLVLYTHAAFSIGPAPGHDRARRCKLHAPSCQGTEVGTGIWSKLVKMCGVHCAGDAGTRVSAEPKAESNFQRQMRCCHTRPITRTPPMLSGQTGSGTRGDCSRPSSSWRRRPGSARSDAWRAPAPRACPPRACRGDARGISSCTPCVPPPRSRWGRDRAPAC